MAIRNFKKSRVITKHKRVLSIAEQAEQSVGYDTWASLSSADKEDVMFELSGGVAMAKGGTAQQVLNPYYQSNSHYIHEEHALEAMHIFKDNDNYGKPPKTVWQDWSVSQREHFLKDHFTDYTTKLASVIEWDNLSSQPIGREIQAAVTSHVEEGKYADGGQTDTNESRFRRRESQMDAQREAQREAQKEKIADLNYKLQRRILQEKPDDRLMTIITLKNGAWAFVNVKGKILAEFDSKRDGRDFLLNYGDRYNFYKRGEKVMADGGNLADGGEVKLVDSDYGNYLLNEIDKKYKQRFNDGVDIKPALAESFTARAKERGNDSRSIDVLEEIYLSYFPANERAAVRAKLSENYGYNKMADGGVISFTLDGKEKTKEFTDKAKMDSFIEMMQEDEPDFKYKLVNNEPEPEQKAAKNLFAKAKAAPKAAASKKEKESIQINGIEAKIARYEALKAIINNAKAEQETIGGVLKEKGVEAFLDLYKTRATNPDTFNLADGGEKIMFIVMDKYKKVEPEKATLLEEYDGLLESVTTYTFNPEVLNRVGDVVSNMIMESKLLSDADKENLVLQETNIAIKKGSIDRLLSYDNPEEIFQLIQPILALK